MASLIFSRAANNGELSIDRIKQLAPAVFATTHRDTLSERYAPLHTATLLPVLSDYGYVPTQASQIGVRKSNAEHKRHFVAFAHRDALIDNGDLRGEIVLYNSHDGTGSVQLFAGAYRFICSNGIIAGNGFNNRVYHSKHGMAGFEDMLKGVVETMPQLLGRIEQLRSKQLSFDQQMTLAQRAAAVRWSRIEDAPVRGSYATNETVTDLLVPSRSEDIALDAWTVFNRIQESVIRGKALIKSFSEKNPDGVYRKARPVNSVAENIRVNRELWNIASEVCDA